MNGRGCRHMSPALIAAGFAECAVCAAGRAGLMKDDSSRQEEAVAYAYANLAAWLDHAVTEAHAAAKAARRRRPVMDLDRLRAVLRSLDQAEQDVDLALYDLRTARGEDG